MRWMFVDERIDYTGEQLRSHWILERFGIAGDAIVSFLGRCDVGFEEMVDLADVLEGKPIKSELMLHFIAEHFDPDIERAILRQRLFISIIVEELNRMLGRPVFLRRGDDIYDGDRKLSVSIATCSPVSSLMHTGLNVTAKGAPVRAAGLEDYEVDPRQLAEAVMRRYVEEMEGVGAAKVKVRWVR